MILLILLLTSVSVTPAMSMHHNFRKKNNKIKKFNVESVLKKIKGGCIGENTDTLLEQVKKNAPENYALQAYIVGKTVYTMARYKYYSHDDTYKSLVSIATQAHVANNRECQHVTEVMKAYWQQKKDPITHSIASKYYDALSFLIKVGEPLYSSQLIAACINKDLIALNMLIQAGCPTHNNNKGVDEQPLVYAVESAAGIEDFTLLKSLIAHVPLNATFKQGDKEVTVAEYFKKRWQDILCEHSEKATVCKYIVDLLTN